MVEQIFVNLPVADLKATIAFWRTLGFDFNPQFTDDKAACLMLGDRIFAMLLVESFFTGFTGRAVPDAAAFAGSITALQLPSREKVDSLVAAAVAAGGTAPRPAKDYGFMYQHGFDDLDGHIWEAFHMAAPPPAA
ncbi:VOC family protein [Aquabacter spiritensis]|uniref:Glyoxalase/Bleomycin resistance-like N-terminal domain-containing protein n=1 Tax=Aquabacter spiritensis TaxID=933073 RepID=A0A4V2UYM9_9HYPH|nr:VOC family protein [Aquabacter spiritensis]TCT08048.1 hypothetical protein EDC64_101567 [Aquabacter spiritensis]